MLIALLSHALFAHAQQAAPDGLSTYLRQSYAAVAKDLSAAVELMPAQDLEFRPAGVAKEVRTFAAIVHHIMAVNSWVCSLGEGKPDPISALGPEPIVDKVRLLDLLGETDRRCTAYLATLTDSALTENLTFGPAPNPLQAARGNAVVFAIAHSNEHYGNLVTYLRAKGLVPRAAASQARFFSPVRKP
ncbi:MAG: DinB family protein [Longimicrobiales bacterium]